MEEGRQGKERGEPSPAWLTLVQVLSFNASRDHTASEEASRVLSIGMEHTHTHTHTPLSCLSITRDGCKRKECRYLD